MSGRFAARFSLSTTQQMVVSMILGIVTGLFFGELVSWMSHIGTAVILLMQMTVFPYIVVSLVGGIGKLDPDTAKRLFGRASIVMLLIWLIGLVVVFTLPSVFPTLESASFFSTSSIQETEPVNYFKLYIPSNPFESMAAGYVPAMVLFSIAMGLSLIGMSGEQKTGIIGFMTTASEIFSRITSALVRVLPIGIFAMSASAAGTMGLDELANLQVYLLSYVLLAVLLTFIIVPWLIACFTPLSFREANRISQAAVITGFTTGSVFIVLPVIVEECKAIMRDKQALSDENADMMEILVPIAYSFPNLGKLSVFLFVFFASWFSGKPIPFTELPSLALSGLFSLFGSVYLAIPFMLNQVQIPADLFQLFVVSGFITGRLGSMAAVLNLVALTLLTVSLFQGVLKISLLSVGRFIGGTALFLFVSYTLVAVGFAHFVPTSSNTSEIIGNMRVAGRVTQNLETKFVENSVGRPAGWNKLQAIQARGLLKVGVNENNVPFSYFNTHDELVGLDVELAKRLAEDLAVDVEFVALDRPRLSEQLAQGEFDIAMSGLAMEVHLMQKLHYSTPVVELNYAIVVPDHRIADLRTRELIQQQPSLRVAYVEHDNLINAIRPNYPNVEFVPINNFHQFFDNAAQDSLDALVISAQAGSAWTLFYPEFGVVVLNKHARYPTAYAVALGNQSLLNFINNWLALQQVNGSLQQSYDYWVLGQGAQQKAPRWSVIKDVLGWVD